MNLLRAIGGVTAGGAAVFAGVTAMGDETTRDESGEIVESGGLGVHAFRIGDCIQLPPTDATGLMPDEVESVEGVPCDDAHDAQAYADFDLPRGAWPGDEVISQQAFEGCLDRWEPAIGTSWQNDADLDIWLLQPHPQGWSAGDRAVTCFVLRIDGRPLVGDVLV